MPRKKVAAKGTGRPVKIQAILDHPSIIILPDGRQFSAPNIVVSPYDKGRLQAGYICMNCLEDLDTAFPDECPFCGFPMRVEQAQRFAREYDGETWLGPTTTLEQEIEIAKEMERREAYKKGILVPAPSIIVPRSVK